MEPRMPGPGPKLLEAQGIPQAIQVSNDALAVVDRLTTIGTIAQDILRALWAIKRELAQLGTEGRVRGDGSAGSD